MQKTGGAKQQPELFFSPEEPIVKGKFLSFRV